MAYAGQISPIHEVSTDRTTWTQASDMPGLLPAAPESAPVQQQATTSSETNPPQDRWYYLDAEGNRTGPIARRQLMELHEQRQIGDETAVWTKGMAEWLPFADAGLVKSRGRANVRLVEPSGGAVDTVPVRTPGVGYGITGLVLGVLSLLSSCFTIIPYAGIAFFGIQLILGVLAICFGAAGMRTQGRGMAIAGLVTGIIAVAIFVLMLVLFFVLVGSLAVWNEQHRNRWN
jgi:hypothetical protein